MSHLAPVRGLDGTGRAAADACPGKPENAAPAAPRVAVLGLSDAGLVTFANAAALSILGIVPEGTAIGARLESLCLSIGLPEAPGATEGTGRIQAGDGGLFSVSWTRSGPDGWIGTILLEKRHASSVACAPVRRDDLTGLADRSSLRSVFQTLSECGVPDLPVTIACIDLDRFKRVNDSLGHAAGDELLRKVGKRLVASVRRTDVVIRMGGDEFAILFAGSTATQIEDTAARIIDVMARPFIVHGHQVVIGASVGLAALRPGETDPAEMLRRADVALYRSKNAGRGCLTWFEEGMFTALDERRLLETELRRAVLLDQFELAYQSQFDVHSSLITGFEALIRWRHPIRGLVPPAAFIPIAEETGEILKIGAWVLQEACRTAMTWPDTMSVAVNVSPVQFEADGFVESVQAALANSGLAPERLELELTESVLVQDDAMVVARMRALRAAGVRLSLDDFGTGYSSLNYLRKYPFTKVKIDQSFVREPLADENAHRIVAAVAGLGSAMGMSVIAEGVETEAQLDRIRLQGCSAAQGYLLSRPIPGSDIASYLEAARTRGPAPSAPTKTEEPKP